MAATCRLTRTIKGATMDRRTFTLSSLAAAGGLAATSRTFGATGPKPKVGLVGCGWFGGVALETMAKLGTTEFISLCDPNSNAIKKTSELLAKYQPAPTKAFKDYREMLASTKHDIVIVATPDHWHTLPAIAAMKAGADVYLEKPISVDVMEGEALVAAARKYNRVVQVNTQRRSATFVAEARDKYLRTGRLGAIPLVETYGYLSSRSNEPMPEAPVPAHLDYEMWTGPAPLLPFRSAIESRAWRSFMEYGNGQVGDLGIHMFDVARFMLGLGWPRSISAVGGIYVDKNSPANTSDTQRAQFDYPAVQVTWESRTWGLPPTPPRHWTDLWGVRFVGEKGTLNLSALGYEFKPKGDGPAEGAHLLAADGDYTKLDPSRAPAAMQSMQEPHVLDFLRARETRSRPVADIEEAHISTACCILANLAQELGRPVSYDPKTRTVKGDAEATRRLARAYRKPWTHPDPRTV
jgi:predicted dehydrogenase